MLTLHLIGFATLGGREQKTVFRVFYSGVSSLFHPMSTFSSFLVS